MVGDECTLCGKVIYSNNIGGYYKGHSRYQNLLISPVSLPLEFPLPKSQNLLSKRPNGLNIIIFIAGSNYSCTVQTIAGG